MNNIIENIFRYFERDVLGVRQMFKKKFGYESEDYPKFSDLTREEDLDREVKTSGYGFTKEMEQDLLEEYGINMDPPTADEEDSSDEEIDEEVIDNDVQLEAYRKEFDKEIKFSEDKPVPSKKAAKLSNQSDSCLRYVEAIAQEKGFLPHVEENLLVDDLSTMTVQQSDKFPESFRQPESNEVEDELTELDPSSREYRMQMVRKLLSDARSQRSYSTTASTIAPSVITGRVKKAIVVQDKLDNKKRAVPKGEASAVRRMRGTNRDIVKEYAGWDDFS